MVVIQCSSGRRAKVDGTRHSWKAGFWIQTIVEGSKGAIPQSRVCGPNRALCQLSVL